MAIMGAPLPHGLSAAAAQALAPLAFDAAELLRWTAARNRDPYDRTTRGRLAETLFRIYEDELPFGTIERGRKLLQLIGSSFPAAELAEAYFANLDALLQERPALQRPGRVALGLGPGRCGSTSLTAIVATIPGSCCTHENRPIVDWQPHEEQVQFHLRRLAVLVRYFPIVFDAAHWWLNLADRVIAQFPDAKLIGLARDRAACARSFIAVKGAYNHWAAPQAPWRSSSWDPAYPSYALPAVADAEEARRLLILAYIDEYAGKLDALARRHPDSCLLLQMGALSVPAMQTRLFRHLGMEGNIGDVRLNVKRTADGSQGKFSY
jgi:hypothetical protein